MFTQLRKRNEGFTIVELLIVIVVIGILAALVLNTFQGVQQRARDTERKTDVNALHTQVEVFYNDNGYYPDGSTYALNTANLPGVDQEALSDPNGNALNVVTSTPTPADGEYYYYPTSCTAGECTGYTLYADLENESTDYTKSALN